MGRLKLFIHSYKKRTCYNRNVGRVCISIRGIWMRAGESLGPVCASVASKMVVPSFGRGGNGALGAPTITPRTGVAGV